MQAEESLDHQLLLGIGVSPGSAAGPVMWMGTPLPEPLWEFSDNKADELAKIEIAAAQVATELNEAAAKMNGPARNILEANALMAKDPTLVDTAKDVVSATGVTAARAAWEAGEIIARKLISLGGTMSQRSQDVRDVRDRIVATITGNPRPGIPLCFTPYVLVANDLCPSDTAMLDTSLVQAFITAGGGPASHTAILAKSLGIPAVVGVGEEALASLVRGQLILVDGDTGVVVPHPTVAQTEKARRFKREIHTITGPGATKDGTRVALLANVKDFPSAQEAATVGAEGIGLFRTEFAFMDYYNEPSVAEQAKQYQLILDVFAHKRVIVRTLDAGADKPLAFLYSRPEENPALGIRGIRTSALSPDVLRRQLQALAVAKVQTQADVWVMAPMISTEAEASEFKSLATQYGLPVAGVMIEVPAAAISCEQILGACDFGSIGTNDLTQYIMAADRQLTELVPLATSWQPAVLQLTQSVFAASARAGKTISVCGEAAANPAYALVLVGLGARSLSMVPAMLGNVSKALEQVTIDQCCELASLALAARTAVAAQQAVSQALSRMVTQ